MLKLRLFRKFTCITRRASYKWDQVFHFKHKIHRTEFHQHRKQNRKLEWIEWNTRKRMSRFKVNSFILMLTWTIHLISWNDLQKYRSEGTELWVGSWGNSKQVDFSVLQKILFFCSCSRCFPPSWICYLRQPPTHTNLAERDTPTRKRQIPPRTVKYVKPWSRTQQQQRLND